MLKINNAFFENYFNTKISKFEPISEKFERPETSRKEPKILRNNPKLPRIFMKKSEMSHDNDQRDTETTNKNRPVPILRKFSPKIKCTHN